MNERYDEPGVETTAKEPEELRKQEAVREYSAERYPSPELRDPQGKSSSELEDDLTRLREQMDSTLTAIERRLSREELVDRAIRALRGGPGEYFTNLGETVKTNPVPAALMGIGLGWLMLSQAMPASTQARSGEAMGKAKERLGEAAGSVSSRMSEAGEKLHGRAAQMREKAGGVAERLRHTASDLKHRAAEARHRSAEGMERARGGLEELREHPVVLGALGLVAGALFAGLAPTSRKEEELLGETGERLRQRATEAGHEAMERARQVGEAAVRTAREETERQLH